MKNRDLSPKRVNEKQTPLDAIESKLDKMHDHKDQYFLSLQEAYFELMKMPCHYNEKQQIRTFKKLTWLLCPHSNDEQDLWNSF